MFLHKILEGAKNLHWGKTLEHKWVKIKDRPKNYTIYNHYNYTEYKITAQKYRWNDVILSTNRTGNQSAIYAENQFLKKSKIMGDLSTPTVRNQSFTTVVVISSLFLFLTMTITAAVVVFCRKKNSVFAFQKSEQEDIADYELDDINTDIEFTETEFESETDSVRPHRKSSRHPSSVGMDSDYENSPVRRPLVDSLQNDSECEDSPTRKHPCRCGADPRGQYQKMVVTAVLEKHTRSQASQCDDEDKIDLDFQTNYLHKINTQFYCPGYTSGLTSDIESDHELSSSKAPMVNLTYGEAPPAYDCLDYYTMEEDHMQTDINKYYNRRLPKPTTKTVTLSKVDVHYENLPCQDVHAQTDKSLQESAVVYVELPPKNDEKPPCEESSVSFVDLPPKRDFSSQSLSQQTQPSTPTLPKAPPTTPTGGVVGLGLSMMGVLSMGQIEEEEDGDSQQPLCPAACVRIYDPEYSHVSSPTSPLSPVLEVREENVYEIISD